MRNTSPLQVFDFQEFPVRVHLDHFGQSWWFAVDVCRALDLTHAPSAIRALDDDERLTVANSHSQTGNGGAQSFNCINESGLYSLIFRSRKPAAKAFKRWVTHEVLPALRQSGVYAVPAEHLPEQAAALPAPDPEVEWMTIPSFAVQSERATAWPLSTAIRFGNMVRRMAKAWGVAHRAEFVDGFGRLPAYPVAMLVTLARTFEPLKVTNGAHDEAPDVWALLDRLPQETWLTFADIIQAARGHGLFRDLVGDAGEVSMQQASRFGRLLGRWMGVAKHHNAYQSLSLVVKGLNRHRRYKVQVNGTVPQNQN